MDREGHLCNVWEAESHFVSDARDNILASLSSIYSLSLAKDGVLSPSGALHWMRCIEVFYAFVSHACESVF